MKIQVKKIVYPNLCQLESKPKSLELKFEKATTIDDNLSPLMEEYYEPCYLEILDIKKEIEQLPHASLKPKDELSIINNELSLSCVPKDQLNNLEKMLLAVDSTFCADDICQITGRDLINGH